MHFEARYFAGGTPHRRLKVALGIACGLTLFCTLWLVLDPAPDGSREPARTQPASPARIQILPPDAPPPVAIEPPAATPPPDIPPAPTKPLPPAQTAPHSTTLRADIDTQAEPSDPAPTLDLSFSFATERDNTMPRDWASLDETMSDMLPRPAGEYMPLPSATVSDKDAPYINRFGELERQLTDECTIRQDVKQLTVSSYELVTLIGFCKQARDQALNDRFRDMRDRHQRSVPE